MLRRVMMAGGGVPPPANDPYWENVVSLLHFDGTDDSTTFTDETGRIWTAAGDAKLDDAYAKWGPTGGNFIAVNASIYTADSDDFYLPGDFTLEMWVKVASVSGRRFLCGQGNSGASDIRNMLEINTIGQLRYWASSTVNFTGTGGSIPTGTYAHIAASRQGNDYRVFINGLMTGSLTNSSVITNYAGQFRVGHCGDFTGFPAVAGVDDFRLTKGVARYTSNFTPPSAPFPDS